MNTALHDIENESLPAHVSICQERYRALEGQMLNLDRQLHSLSGQMQDIKSMVDQLHQDQQTQWTQARNWLIGVLIAIVGSLGSVVFFA